MKTHPLTALLALLFALHGFAVPPPETISFSAPAYVLPESVNGQPSYFTVVRSGGTGAPLTTAIQVGAGPWMLPVSFPAGAASVEVQVPGYSPLSSTLSLTLLSPDVSIAVAPNATATLTVLNLFTQPESDVYVGVFDSASEPQNVSGMVLVTVNAASSFTAQVKTAIGRGTLRGAFTIGNHATVGDLNSTTIGPFQLDLQRHYADGANQLSGTLSHTNITGALPITFARALRRSELGSLPADRSFTGALRSPEGARMLAAPVHLELSPRGRWTLLGYDRQLLPISASYPALAGNRVCFADVRTRSPLLLGELTRTALLTYDPVAHALTGTVQACHYSANTIYYTESGPIGAYVMPMRGQLPGVFAGAPPAAARFLVTDQANTQTVQSFTWRLPALIQPTGGNTIPFSLHFMAKTGLVSGKFTMAGVSKPKPFTAALVSGTGTADDGTFLGTAKPDAFVRLLQIAGP